MALSGTTSAVRVVGLDAALKKLSSDLADVPFKSLQGMIAGGFIVQRASQKLVPVDTANLKASATTIWSTKPSGSSPRFKGKEKGELAANHTKVVAQEKAGLSKNVILKPEVEVAYTAAYAIYVHEDLNAKHTEGQEAKFLEKAVISTMSEVIAAVKIQVGRNK